MPAESIEGGWVDVSVPVSERLVAWPGDPPYKRTRDVDMDNGAVCNVSHLDMGAHTGTHMDAPLHFIRDGAGMERMPLEATVGVARVIAIEDEHVISAEELARHGIRPGERLLFKTRSSASPWWHEAFDEDFVHLDKPAAQYLVDAGVQTVGVDYLSVGGYKADGSATHRVLLGSGVWVIEGLNLVKVTPGTYEFVCLPIKLVGSDGAPARAMLRPM